MQDSGINVFFQGINSLLLLKGLWTTLHISLLSAGLSIPLGILLGIFMTLKNPIARVVSQIYLEIVRIMPQLVLLFVVYFGFTRAFGWNLSAYSSATRNWWTRRPLSTCPPSTGILPPMAM